MYIGSIDTTWSLMTRRFRLPRPDITCASYSPRRQGVDPTTSVALATKSPRCILQTFSACERIVAVPGTAGAKNAVSAHWTTSGRTEKE